MLKTKSEDRWEMHNIGCFLPPTTIGDILLPIAGGGGGGGGAAAGVGGGVGGGAAGVVGVGGAAPETTVPIVTVPSSDP